MEKQRGRKAIEVQPAELQAEITKLEQSQPDGKFPNRSALWNAIEATEWAKSRQPRPLTGQVAYLMANKNNLTILTPVGVKGRAKGAPPVIRVNKRSRKIPLDVLGELKKTVPQGYEKLVNKAASGSMKAAIKLKCLDCTAFQKKEIAGCTIQGCSLFNFRPYKRLIPSEVTKNESDSNAVVLSGELPRKDAGQ